MQLPRRNVIIAQEMLAHPCWLLTTTRDGRVAEILAAFKERIRPVGDVEPFDEPATSGDDGRVCLREIVLGAAACSPPCG